MSKTEKAENNGDAMMEILILFLRNFPVAWSSFIAGIASWALKLPIELGYGDFHNRQE